MWIFLIGTALLALAGIAAVAGSVSVAGALAVAGLVCVLSLSVSIGIGLVMLAMGDCRLNTCDGHGSVR